MDARLSTSGGVPGYREPYPARRSRLPAVEYRVETRAMSKVRIDPVNGSSTGRIRFVEFTDPISVWCWGLEPAVRRLEVLYPDSVEVVVRMGGLFEDFGPMRANWTRMSGGKWKESVLAFMNGVAEQHRMPMDPEKMFATMDDFTSTWPGCVAAKAGEAQGRDAGRRYLRRLREAVLLEGKPIHHRGMQEALAAEAGLDVPALAKALDDGSAKAAFERDLEECRSLGITGFPTVEVRRGAESVRIEGWHPWEEIEETVRKLDPGLRPRRLEATPAAVEELFRRYPTAATREVAAVLTMTDDDAEILLEDLEAEGRVTRREAGSGPMWAAGFPQSIQEEGAKQAESSGR